MNVKDLISLIYNKACDDNTKITFYDYKTSDRNVLEGNYTAHASKVFFSKKANVLVIANNPDGYLLQSNLSYGLELNVDNFYSHEFNIEYDVNDFTVIYSE